MMFESKEPLSMKSIEEAYFQRIENSTREHNHAVSLWKTQPKWILCVHRFQLDSATHRLEFPNRFRVVYRSLGEWLTQTASEMEKEDFLIEFPQGFVNFNGNKGDVFPFPRSPFERDAKDG